MNWSVPLLGHQFDLEVLARSFRDDPRVESDGKGGYILRASRFEQLADAEAVRAEADRIVSEMNGAGRIFSESYENVTAANQVRRENQTGGEDAHVFITDSVRVRSSVSAVVLKAGGATEEVVESPPPIPSDTLALAMKNADFAQALRFMSQEPPTWHNLYKVWELVKRNVRGRITEEGWATEGEIERLTATADRPELSGDDSRHAVTKGSPAGERLRIELEEGVALCRRLLARWAEYLRSSSP